MTIRQAIRSFLLPLTIAEIQREIEISQEAGDTFREEVCREFLEEVQAEA